MDNQQRSFIVYTEWARPLEHLTLAEKGEVFQAILRYAQEGRCPPLESSAAAMAFSFIQLRLDENAEKWAATRKKRQAAGQAGARKMRDNLAKAAKSCQSLAVNGNEDVNGNENVNGNGNASCRPQQEAPEEPGWGGQEEPPPEFSLSQNLWAQLKLGSPEDPALEELLREFRSQGIQEEVLAEGVRETAEHRAQNPLAYLRKVLTAWAAEGSRTLPQWRALHGGASRAKRVDRETPSGRDFLKDAVNRTHQIRRKRTD